MPHLLLSNWPVQPISIIFYALMTIRLQSSKQYLENIDSRCLGDLVFGSCSQIQQLCFLLFCVSHDLFLILSPVVKDMY